MNVSEHATENSAELSEFPLHLQLLSRARREHDPDISLLLKSMAKLVDRRTPSQCKHSAVSEVLRTMACLAFRDALTGVLNRSGFMRDAARLLEQATRSGQRVALLYFDVNDLKRVNDSAGHASGDALLARMGNVLRLAFRHDDVYGRVGGDEFAALIVSQDEQSDQLIRKRLQQTLAVVNKPFDRFPLSLSIGIVARTPAATATLGDLINQADSRMYVVKHAACRHTTA